MKKPYLCSKCKMPMLPLDDENGHIWYCSTCEQSVKRTTKYQELREAFFHYDGPACIAALTVCVVLLLGILGSYSSASRWWAQVNASWQQEEQNRKVEEAKERAVGNVVKTWIVFLQQYRGYDSKAVADLYLKSLPQFAKENGQTYEMLENNHSLNFLKMRCTHNFLVDSIKSCNECSDKYDPSIRLYKCREALPGE